MRSIAPTVVFLVLGAGSAGAQWQTIESGGDTLCSDGSAHRFFVHPGDSERLVIEFEGGGACWNAATCASDIYTRNVAIGPDEALDQGLLQGIYERDKPDNPIREWTHVYVPYCSGDVHWGLKDQTYEGPEGPFTIFHRGAANAGAAVAWAFENVVAPSQVLVTGCSAGGYGSIMWAPRVMSHYSGARTAHLADSAAGVMPETFLGVLRESWNVDALWPNHIPALASEPPDPALTVPVFYEEVAAYYPLASFSQFNTTSDSTQFVFTLLAGALLTPAEWSAKLLASIAEIEASTPNFHSYTATGAEHCIINQSTFYTREVNGVRFSDWLTNLLATGDPGTVVP